MNDLRMKCREIIVCIICFVCIHQANAQEVKPSVRADLNKLWSELNLEPYYHIGLSIYDYEKQKFVFQHRDDNYFTPASNLKLVTMWTALQYLDADIAAGYYITKGDSMIIWGGGDPGSYYPENTAKAPLVDFISTSDKKIFFADDHFTTTRFGNGWAWDDYKDSYQAERNAFPLYGNQLWIHRYQDSAVIKPPYFDVVTKVIEGSIDTIYRDEWGNSYTYIYSDYFPEEEVHIPVSLYEKDVRYIWEEATGKEIQFISRPFARNAVRIPGTTLDSMILPMMQESDNFIAEQLLLASAFRQIGEMNEKKFIESLMKGALSELPDKIQWVDGSGLSRYNLLTPRSCIWFLDQILKKKGIDYLKKMLPAGGASGSLIDRYKGRNGIPYVYAKTGSLKNNHCLTGLLITKSGKVLLFSWMNNQFTVPSRVIKDNMEKIFIWLRDNY